MRRKNMIIIKAFCLDATKANASLELKTLAGVCVCVC